MLSVPDKTTQSRIADFLDQKTSEIDQAIEKKEKLINLLKEQKDIIIQKAVTQGLDPNVKMKDSKVDWIGEIRFIGKLKNYLRFAVLLTKIQLSEKDQIDLAN